MYEHDIASLESEGDLIVTGRFDSDQVKPTEVTADTRSLRESLRVVKRCRGFRQNEKTTTSALVRIDLSDPGTVDNRLRAAARDLADRIERPAIDLHRG